MKKLCMMLLAVAVMVGLAAQAQRRGGRSQGGHDPNEVDGVAPGKFDFYLLTVSWEPGYCASPAGQHNTQECANPPRFELHGLWPENSDGTYPAFCVPPSPGPSNPGAYSDIYPSAAFLSSEWKKHGVCSGLSADAYLQDARRAVQSLKLPAQLTGNDVPPSMSPNGLLQLFANANPGKPADSFRLSCGSNHFSAIEMCIDKNMNAISCSQIKTCKAGSVVIDPPTH
jgi:ribonuclease T2